MAVRAIAGLLRVVERSRALAGHAAGLPVVVLVEASEPAILIDRNIQMNFVACRAKFSGTVAHEWLHEGAAVRFRSGVGHEMLEILDELDSSCSRLHAAADTTS